MKGKKGFTMVELLVCLAIIGILSATAIPAFQTLQQRTRGQEAMLMSRQIIEGQILYYLENNSFFPPDDSDPWIISDDEDPNITGQRIQKIKENLNIEIPKGRPLEYTFESYNNAGGNQFVLTVRAEYALFKDGTNFLWATVDEDGKTDWQTGTL